ncbi:MAG: GYF domain-containing protein [Bdellovibrionia bacterium]
MENSGKMLFGEDASQWYVAVGQKWIGPMSASDIYEKVASHQITLAHYAWKKGQAEWKRICDIKTFQSLGPHQPQKTTQKQIQSEASAKSPASKVSPAKMDVTRTWYLHLNQSQTGPFSTEEIIHFLKTGKIQGRVHAWRDGMKNWDRLERLPEFRDLAASSLPTKAPIKEPAKANEEQRYHPRRPLVAKILMSDQETVIVGVCRDISIGGLQVLTETVPGDIGTKIKMNISPSSNESGNPIEPFVAEGVIVRILEDGRGFSFRFNKLADRAKQAIESYIESPL